jgi:putative transposase
MNLEELQKIAKVAAKSLKTEQDLNEFSAMLTKTSVEAALNAELDDPKNRRR